MEHNTRRRLHGKTKPDMYDSNSKWGSSIADNRLKRERSVGYAVTEPAYQAPRNNFDASNAKSTMPTYSYSSRDGETISVQSSLGRRHVAVTPCDTEHNPILTRSEFNKRMRIELAGRSASCSREADGHC